MLPPVTEHERTQYTLKLQFEKAIQELLAEAYEAGYEGYLDIWPILDATSKQLIMSVQSKKISSSFSKPSHKEALRYHVSPGKGCKRIR